MLRTLFVIAILFTLTVLLGSAVAYAGVGACQPAYGGGQNCPVLPNIVVDKKVKNPQTGQFVDNLNVNNVKFKPNDPIEYQISVRNTGNASMRTLVVRDFFPRLVTFTSGPGQFENNVLTFVIGELKPGESETINVAGRIAGTLPSDTGVYCDAANTTNKVLVSLNNQISEDAASLCVQSGGVLGATNPTETKGGLPVFPTPSAQNTPKTGPEAMALAVLLPSGLIGTFLLKRTGVKSA